MQTVLDVENDRVIGAPGRHVTDVNITLNHTGRQCHENERDFFLFFCVAQHDFQPKVF